MPSAVMRRRRMRSSSALAGPEPVGNLTVEQPGFTLGGRIIKDKLFWFVSAEFIRQSSFSTARIPAHRRTFRVDPAV